MFVQLLERIDPNDAKLIIAVKDQKLSYKGLSYKLVKDTWPDLLPDIEEKEVSPEEDTIEENDIPTANSGGVD